MAKSKEVEAWLRGYDNPMKATIAAWCEAKDGGSASLKAGARKKSATKKRATAKKRTSKKTPRKSAGKRT